MTNISQLACEMCVAPVKESNNHSSLHHGEEGENNEVTGRKDGELGDRIRIPTTMSRFGLVSRGMESRQREQMCRFPLKGNTVAFSAEWLIERNVRHKMSHMPT